MICSGFGSVAHCEAAVFCKKYGVVLQGNDALWGHNFLHSPILTQSPSTPLGCRAGRVVGLASGVRVVQVFRFASDSKTHHPKAITQSA